MAGQTQTEISPLKHRNTAPVTPRSEKKPGNFFSRHLGRRRRSSVSLPNGHSISTPTAPQQPNVVAAKSTVRKSSVGSNHQEIDNTASRPKTSNGEANGVAHSPEPVEEVHDESATEASGGSWDIPPASPNEPARENSKSSGVKWAEGYADTLPTRTRRASSAGTTGTRRTSIYVRGVDGRFNEGADAGVGSKARKLSVHLPEQMQTDECSLNDHFSLFARNGKKEIGAGGAASVKKMQSKTVGPGNDKVYAVKEFREWDSEEEDERDYVRKIKSEYAIAKSCQHPNIVETYRLCVSDHGKKWHHVMQLCECGDLNDIIKEKFMTVEDRNCLFKQLLRGIEYLHRCGIAHRDIKSENLLVNKDGCLKIADFGTAEVFCGTHPGLRGCRRPSIIDDDAPIRMCEPGLVGSRPYMAPEIIKHQDAYDPRAVDIWSCAIVYLTMCIGGTPWECASTDVKNYNIYCSTWDEWLLKYPDGEIEEGRPLPSFVQSKQFRALDDLGTKIMMMGMLHPDPSRRWSAKNALDTKTVTEYPCCQQEGYSDDIKTRQRKAMHNHVPPSLRNKKGSIKSSTLK